MKGLRRGLLVLSLILSGIWLLSPPLIGSLIETHIAAQLPVWQQQLARQGIELHLHSYERGYWQSQARWQISRRGQSLSHIRMHIQHGALSSAGANLIRLNWQHDAMPEDLLRQPLQGQIRLTPLAQLIAAIHSQTEQQSSSAALRFSVLNPKHIHLQAENLMPRGGLPPLHLNAHLHSTSRQAQNAAPAQLPPPLQALIRQDWQLDAGLILYPADPQAEIRAQLVLKEQFDNALQLIALRQRDSLISLLEGSGLRLQLPLEHTNPQAVLDFLAQPPWLLNGVFAETDAAWQTQWQVRGGRIHADTAE